MLLLATESTARTPWRHTRDETISHNGAEHHRELLRLQRNLPDQIKFDEVISSWDDRNTFFTPQLVQANITYQNKSYTPCPWRYVVDHDFNRYPQYIYQIECDASNKYKCHNPAGVLGTNCECRKVQYTIPTLKRTACDSSTGEQHWIISQTTFPGACVPRFIPN